MLVISGQAAGNLQRQGRLPDATGAGQRDHAAGCQLIPQMPQGIGAPDQFGGRHRQVGHDRRGIGWCGGLDGVRCIHSRRMGRPVADQAIASPARGLHHAAVRPKSLAQGGHVHLERVLLDDRGRPDARHELILGDQRADRRGQNFENVERPATDWNRHSVCAQFTLDEINLPLSGRLDQW